MTLLYESNTISDLHDRIPVVVMPHFTPVAFRYRRESENGVHVVIFELLNAFRCLIEWHVFKPASPIPQPSDASNVVNVHENGTHVVIL